MRQPKFGKFQTRDLDLLSFHCRRELQGTLLSLICLPRKYGMEETRVQDLVKVQKLSQSVFDVVNNDFSCTKFLR